MAISPARNRVMLRAEMLGNIYIYTVYVCWVFFSRAVWYTIYQEPSCSLCLWKSQQCTPSHHESSPCTLAPDVAQPFANSIISSLYINPNRLVINPHVSWQIRIIYMYVALHISIPPFIPPVALHFARQTPRCRASPGEGRLGNLNGSIIGRTNQKLKGQLENNGRS